MTTYSTVQFHLTPFLREMIERANEPAMYRVWRYLGYTGKVIRPVLYKAIKLYLTKISPLLSVAQASFYNRYFRQKYFIGNNYQMPFSYGRQGLTNYRSRMKSKPKTITATNRKHLKNRKVKSKAKNTSVAKLHTKVNKLHKAIKADRSTHTFKKIYSADLDSAVGLCNHTYFGPNRVSELEVAIANLRYYDPATPGTLLTASGATGTFSRDIHIKNTWSKLRIRNNYQVPARVKVYLCIAKHDTNDHPITTYQAGITDQVISGGNATTPAIYLNDIEVVKEDWKIDCVMDKVLMPGRERSVSHSTGAFEYDPAHTDTDSTAYQKRYKAFTWVVRTEGVCGHDTVADEQTLLASSLDIEAFFKVDIIYDAGINLNDIYVTDTRGTTFTTGGVVSSMPVADNVPYSAT